MWMFHKLILDEQTTSLRYLWVDGCLTNIS
jgi:hypothetical protein